MLEDHSTAERDAERATGGLIASADEVAITVRDKMRENWKARVILNDNVQLLESLHAHDAGRCRNLHHIANVAVLLDKPHSFPISLFISISLFAPTIDTLQG